MKNKYRKYTIGILATVFLGCTISVAAQDSIAVVSRINVEHLKTMPDMQLSNSLQGMAAGLIVIPGTGSLGNARSTFYVRGQHNNGTNNAIVIVDGIQRSIDNILPEEIESIEVLKDATAKILYGAQATNGVVLVRTKRGIANQRSIRVGFEYGVQKVTRLPEFLDSYNYATLFNEACLNDGLIPYYSDGDLQGYKNSTGVNDLLYPNVNYYDQFLRNSVSYRKALLELNGGNDGAKYAVTVGYSGNSGLEKVGERSALDRLNARGNLDIRITDFLNISADVAAQVEKKDWGGKDLSSLFSEMSTLRPNEYPFVISRKDLAANGISINEDALAFGASSRKSNNVYSEMLDGGTTSERYVNSQNNLGMNMDLNESVEGLSAKAYITFDNYSYLMQQLRNTYSTYSIDRYLNEAGDIELRFTERQKLNLPKNQSISSSQTYRVFGWNAYLDYKHTFNETHNLGFSTGYRYNTEEQTGNSQDIKEGNFSFRANYAYDKKYLFEATLAAMGSNKFKKGDKYFLGYSVGTAWVISKETFMENVDGVNNLLLKASYGHLGYAGNTEFFLYRTNWNKNSTNDLQLSSSQGVTTTDLIRYGNPNLKWEYSDEYNVGIKGVFLNNHLAVDMNHFHEMRKNIISINSAKYAAVGGDFIPYENVGEVMNQGFDAYLNWSDKVNGDFSYNAGLNMTYTKNKLRKSGDLTNIEEYRKAIGKPTSSIFGLQSIGLFGKDVDINKHVFQSYSNYGVGDIAYADLNGDNMIDDNDQTKIGQSFPTTVLGVDFSMNYKGFGLYVLGTAMTGVTKMLTNAYYWNNGLDGYSKLALDRYHPTNNPQGTQPHLTTTEGQNNYRNSTFWAEDGSFFRLKNVELSYTLNTKNKIGKSYKFYVRGANLFVLSSIKDLDPELIDAGISNSPTYRSFTGGVSINF